MSKKIIAGPWVGEFGWELFCWQSYLRALNKHSKYKVTPMIRPGHEFIYQDFMSGYVYFNPGDAQPNMNSSLPIQTSKIDSLNELIKYYKDQDYTYIKPIDIDLKNDKQEFICYNSILELKVSNHIVIHPRSTNKFNTGYRNWSKEKWDELVRYVKGLSPGILIYNSGTVKDSHPIEGTIDIRGVNLAELAHFMCSAKMCIGPSSGPMHFASLCGTKHLVWSARDTVGVFNNKDRYERIWNPLGTKVIFIEDGGWDPDVNLIYHYVKKELI